MVVPPGEVSSLKASAKPRLALWGRGLLRFARKKPLGAAGAIILVIMISVALLAPWLAPYSPTAMHFGDRWALPSQRFPLGADEYGRDILSRILYGGRISLTVGFLSTLLGTAVGALLGLVSGYWGGKVEAVIERIVDILMTLPMMVLALVILVAMKPSLTGVIIAISVPMVPVAARVVRSTTLSIKETQYIDAARVIGMTDWRIMFRHVMPNCFAPYMIVLTGNLGMAIVIEASLGFLGMGVPPPTPTWGQMLTTAVQGFQLAPLASVFPGVAISLAVFGFNLFGDSLRDVLDPRLRGR